MPNQIQAGFEFEAIFQEAAIGIIVTNSSFEIILSNRFADKLFGFDENELLGENISLLIPNHLKDRHHSHLDQLGHEKPISRPMLPFAFSGRELYCNGLSFSFFNVV